MDYVINGDVIRTHSKDGLTPAKLVQPTDDVIRTVSRESQRGNIATISVEEVAERFKTNLEKGLTSAEAAAVLERDGLNELFKPPKPTLFMLFLMQMVGFIIILLMVAACASIAVNATGNKSDDPLSYTTGIAIFVLVLINAGIAAWTEHQAGGALDALAKMSQAAIDVIRDGVVTTVATNTVVRGDIVILGTGDVVPADLRLIVAEDLKVSEMCLTGEPEDVAKSIKVKIHKAGEPEKLTPANMAFSACSTTNGKGRGIVCETGMDTRVGSIAKLMAGSGPKTSCLCMPDTSEGQTPLQRNVQSLGAKIGVLAIVTCVIVFGIGVAIDTRDPDNQDDPSWLYMILIAVTLAVAAIPEGIPLCVTISLSIGCSQMVSNQVLVRKLAAVETLGSASVICSDKTGTLTEGKMTMIKAWCGDTQYLVSGKGFDPTTGKFSRAAADGTSGEDGNNDSVLKSTLCAAMQCSNTTISKVIDGKDEKWEPKGNSSEAPIIVAGMKVGFTTEQIEKDNKRVLEIPFSSSRKMMLTASDYSGKSEVCPGGIKLPAGSNFLTVCKGAPNFIIDICTSWTDGNGDKQPLNEAKKAAILDIVDEYSSQALRVLAIAVRPMPELPYDANDDEVTADTKFAECRKDIQLLGLVASIDPDRDGVKESVISARGAGIRVVMITGDYLKTAAAIAKNVNILMAGDDENVCAVDCKSLRPGKDDQYLPDSGMDALTLKTKVFARAKPEDKLEIVKSLQRQGFVSAMTGDGVNDAPALNQADIGVAMGIQGTEVAKGASDMILMDDNFCSIVQAVEKGRVIYSGIQKFVAFIMSVHIAEVLQIFVCIVTGIPVMRTPLQILFLILVTDLPPSIALGMEPGDPSILKELPRPKSEPIVLMWMWVSICMNGLILSAVIIVIYLISLNHYVGEIFQTEILALDNYEEDLSKARTVCFISLVYAENIRAYISRSFDKPFWVNLCGNSAMQLAIITAQIALYVAVLVPGVSDKILGLRGLEIGVWGWLVALLGPLGTLILCELAKLITIYQTKQYQAKLKKDREAAELKSAVAAADPIDSYRQSTIIKGGGGLQVVEEVDI